MGAHGTTEPSMEHQKFASNTDASEEEFGIVAKGAIIHQGSKV